MFQFDEVIGIVERSLDTLQAHRLYAWEHISQFTLDFMAVC
jgi:hypothetical protein